MFSRGRKRKIYSSGDIITRAQTYRINNCPNCKLRLLKTDTKLNIIKLCINDECSSQYKLSMEKVDNQKYKIINITNDNILSTETVNSDEDESLLKTETQTVLSDNSENSDIKLLNDDESYIANSDEYILSSVKAYKFTTTR